MKMEGDREENVWFNDIEGEQTSVNNDETANSQTRKVEPFLTVLEVNNEDKLLLGASYLGGNYWTGSLWLFSHPNKAPVGQKSIAGIEMDVGASDAKFYDDNNVICGDYSGVVSMLSVKAAADDCPVYFTRLSNFLGHDGYVSTLDTSSSTATLVTGSSDSCVFVWDVQTQLSKKRYSAHMNGVSAVSIKPEEGQIFVTCSSDCSSLIWDARAEKPASSIVHANIGFSSIDWLDESSIILADYSGCVQLIDIRNLATLSRIQLSPRYPVQRLRVNRAKKLVAAAVDEPCLQILTAEGGELKFVYKSTEHSGLIRGLSWSKLTGRLHSCGWDTQVLHHSVPAT